MVVIFTLTVIYIKMEYYSLVVLAVKVQLVVRAHRAVKVYKVYRVYKDAKVLKVLVVKVSKVHKDLELRVEMDLLLLRVLRVQLVVKV